MDNTTPRLLVEPKNELVFTGPFDNIVHSSIKLTNTTSQRVCFKVKTTVPRSYCVKPSSGFVEPNSSLDVEVLLQPLTSMPTDRNRHKFMVQSLIAPSDSNADVEQLWRDAIPGDLQDSKLKCVMKMPEENVSISPSTALVFNGPFTQPSSAFIKITNNSRSNICFKIQITNPKMFSVSPVTGLIDSFGTQNVKVVMHPWDYDPKEKYKDRFMIQWVSAPDLTTYNDTIWSETIARNDRVLKCIYQISENSSDKALSSIESSKVSASKENSEKDNLVAELNKLRSENSSLKESQLRLRRIANSDISQNPMSMKLVIALIVIALISGMLAGHFVF